MAACILIFTPSTCERLLDMGIDYIATGVFFMWLSFSIFSWVVRTATEINDSPATVTPLEEEVLRQAAMRSGRRIRDESK